MKKSLFLLILCNAILGLASAHAQVVNGDFTAGLSGWSVLGNPTIDTSAPPMGLAAAAAISSTNTLDPADAVDYTAIQDALHVYLPSTNIGTETPVNGEAIYQTITLSAPAQLSFQFQMTAQDTRILTTDQVGYSLTDWSSVSVGDPNPGTFYALNAAEALNSYTTITTGVIAPGTYILGFISYNTADNHGLTSFEVSDVDVPEPATWILMAGGLALLVGLSRSTRRHASSVR